MYKQLKRALIQLLTLKQLKEAFNCLHVYKQLKRALIQLLTLKQLKMAFNCYNTLKPLSSTAYTKQLTKTFGLKRSAIVYLSTVVYCSPNGLLVYVSTNTTVRLCAIIEVSTYRCDQHCYGMGGYEFG